MLALLLSVSFSPAYAQEDPLAKAGTLLKEGKSKAALKELQPLLRKAMTLQIQALSKAGSDKQALKVYEYMVRLRGSEQLPLLKGIA